MSFTKEQFEQAERIVIEDRPTYFYEGTAYCMGKKANEELYCGNIAGKGTHHVGTGRCKYHGGRSGRPLTTGKHALVSSSDLERAYQKHLELDTPSLRNERAILRAILEDDWISYVREKQPEMESRIVTLVDRITKMYAKSDEIVLTPSSAKYLMLKATDAAKKLCQSWFINAPATIVDGRTIVGQDLVDYRLSEFILAWRQFTEELGDGSQ